MKTCKVKLFLFCFFTLAIGIFFACHLIYPLKSVSIRGVKFVCQYSVYSCVKGPLKLTINVDSPAKLGNCYVYKNNVIKTGAAVYCGPAVEGVLKEVNYNKILGADLVMLKFEDRLVKAQNYLKLSWTLPKQNIEGIYLAYDSRVKNMPLLMDKFYPIYVDGKPASIKVSLPYELTDLPHVQMNLYRLKDAYFTSPLEIPSNFAGTATFTCDKSKITQYLLIVNPATGTNCTTGSTKFKENKQYEVCLCDTLIKNNDSTKIKLEAKKYTQKLMDDYIQEQQKKNPAEKIWSQLVKCYNPGKATCPEDDIVSTTTKLTVQPKSFNYHSLVKFDPVKYKSIVDVTIGNNKFTNIKVSGPIHFQYEMDKLDVLKTMKINSIILSIDDVETFKNNVLYLKDFAYAECMDTSPLSGKPCNKYRIPTGTLNCCLCCRQKGDPYIFLVNNSTPVVIQIDHNNQMLQFSGKLKTDVIVDDQKTAMTFDVNLKGHFENFAPKASAIESQRIAECQENANKDPIYLSAAASFDIYDTLPTTPVNYDWYEDYRQSTEIFWGHGSNLIIPPWSLSYGIHHFTLIVLDNVGVADTDTFSVDVRDTVPPKLSIPADIHMVTFPPYSPTKAYLGEAVASDACCVGNVYISNDAPANSLFPPGNLTHVTWRADDSRGNTTTKVQKVYLYWVGEPHDWYTNLRFLVDFKINFKETMANTYNEINLIQDFEPVAIDFHQTTEFLHKVRAIIEEIPEDPDLRVSKPELLERLDPIIHAIQEMDELIAQMRRMDRRDEIKAEVLARIIRIAELLQEFGFILEEYDTSRFDRYEF